MPLLDNVNPDCWHFDVILPISIDDVNPEQIGTIDNDHELQHETHY